MNQNDVGRKDLLYEFSGVQEVSMCRETNGIDRHLNVDSLLSDLKNLV
jgi:hypothetical protein